MRWVDFQIVAILNVLDGLTEMPFQGIEPRQPGMTQPQQILGNMLGHQALIVAQPGQHIDFRNLSRQSRQMAQHQPTSINSNSVLAHPEVASDTSTVIHDLR
ncbi:MAG: hypothetical protein R3F40_16440 [Candidatus Competibacteraceae bacterium]